MKLLTRRSLFVGLAASLAAFPVGCGGRQVPWQVVSQEAQNPLFGQRRFRVRPIQFADLSVGEKSETDYLSSKDESTRADWQKDKSSMSQIFTQALKQHARSNADLVIDTDLSNAPFVIEPVVGYIEPGLYIGVYQKPSQVDMTARVLSAEGELIDEIRMTANAKATLSNPSIGGRLRQNSDTLGAWMAQYLASRVREPHH
jgi:hypothetical protein